MKIVALLISLTISLMATNLQKGIEAYKKGEYGKAYEYYVKAAKEGSPAAKVNLGLMYKYNMVVKKNLKKAFELFKEAAETGYARGETELGTMYEEGLGTEKDPQRAFMLYTKAANKGYPKAIYRLARLYEEGEGTKKDLKRRSSGTKEVPKMEISRHKSTLVLCTTEVWEPNLILQKHSNGGREPLQEGLRRLEAPSDISILKGEA